MSKLYVLVGVSGSGKSTFAKEILLPSITNGRIVSTDAIRGELFGDEGEQKNGDKVFALAYKRTKDFLKTGHDVIFDATSLTKKARRILINYMSGIENLKIQACIILASPETAIENQQKRDRQVPEDVILRQIKSFSLPHLSEGFTEPNIYYNAFYDKQYLATTVNRLYGVDQTSKWHIEDAGTHTDMVVANVKKYTHNQKVIEAAKYHDIGKLYTKTIDENNNAHFYGHANVSAYIYLCGTVNKRKIGDVQKYIAELIAHHDDSLQKNFDINIFRKEFGSEMAKDLVMLRTADIKGAITAEKLQKMPVLEIMNTFPNWKEILKREPMNLKIKEDSGYILLKYNQIESDMSYKAVQESRGSIFKKNQFGKYEYVCRPFDKFFNYGEEYASSIDWKTARITEKIDGSLMKVWKDDGKWHLSTNGTIDAFSAFTQDETISFGEVFERVLGTTVTELGKRLNGDYTYLFELTSPETQVVISYSDGIYFLTSRDTRTGMENTEMPDWKGLDIKAPRIDMLTTLDEVIEAVKKMSKDEEGYVVSDCLGRRIKVKSPEYLIAAHIIGNRNLTERKIIEYIKEEKIDDLLAYSPQNKEKVHKVEEKLEQASDFLDKEWNKYSSHAEKERKEFAEIVKYNFYKDFLFRKLNNRDLTGIEYLMNKPVKNIEDLINRILAETEFDKIADDKTISLETILQEADKLNDTTKEESEPDIDISD